MKHIFNVARFVWRVTAFFTAANFFYYSAMLTGAWLTLNELPSVPMSTQALAFIAAGMLMLEQAFPWLAHQTS